ncbi:hypothetical protein [Pelagibacterium lentulum]|uniref:Uncharacterized protein n=2 Tax=Pelagibacterium lentulum TaxID=2029865 RepID=A0A916W483_9HYPH|nr:hypothetical protein [Pelagibacterium lentulum]GGA64603.1 hypothetical protein GCM10011499_38830 [Pelagibacterium lentulum]
MTERVKQTLSGKMIRFVEATFAPINAEKGMSELGDDHELTLTVGQLREFYELAKAEPILHTELKQQRAWVAHWIEDVRAGLKPTPESLEARLVSVNDALSKATGAGK